MTETDMSVRRLPNTIYIARGAHAPGDPTAGSPACTMEWAAWLAGEEEWSDHPECTHPVIAAGVRAVNDALDDGPRQRLAELIPTLIDTADRRDDPVARHQLSVRLAVYAAERVLHLIPPPNQAVCMRAITAARAWADAPTGEARAAARVAALAAADDARAACADARAAALAAAAAYAACDDADVADARAAALAAAAAYAGADAARAAADVADVFYAAYAACAAADAASHAANAADDAIGLLRGLISEHARLTTQEG